MKKLFLKLTILLLAVCAFLGIIEYFSLNPGTKETVALLTNSDDFLELTKGNTDIRGIILSTRADDGTTVLVIGDSISRQMFSQFAEDMPKVHIACANAAINITGQYMLAMEYLDTHPATTDVWLYAHPLTITATFNLNTGYVYGVIPFAQEGSLRYLDDEMMDKMASVYGRWTMSERVASLINDSPVNSKFFFSYLNLHRSEYEQANAYEISSEMILKLREVCEERGIRFHFYSSPSTEFYREKIEETREDYMASPLYELYPDYLDGIYYFPSEWSDDLTHFGAEYANRETYEYVIENAYPESVLCYNED